MASTRASSRRKRLRARTGLLAGLRWGESAALCKTDIDWQRGRLHVQRSFSEKANRIEVYTEAECRFVEASPVLLAALRAHVDAVDRDGAVKGWTPEQRQLVFPNTRGQITHHGPFVGGVWRPLLLRAELPCRKYHATRLTFRSMQDQMGSNADWGDHDRGSDV